MAAGERLLPGGRAVHRHGVRAVADPAAEGGQRDLGAARAASGAGGQAARVPGRPGPRPGAAGVRAAARPGPPNGRCSRCPRAARGGIRRVAGPAAAPAQRRRRSRSRDSSSPCPDASVGPLPAKPLDIWLGGSAPAGLRRVGRLADGWLGSLLTPGRGGRGGRHVIQDAAARGRAGGGADHFGLSVPVALDGIPDALRASISRRRPDTDPADPGRGRAGTVPAG